MSVDGYVSVGKDTRLCYREMGAGQPIVVLHGGPDFNHRYLLPELDRLADAFRLIYYDQRGRGFSERNVRAADVSIQSEVADLDTLRTFFGLEQLALLGHSWGGLLAAEYAQRHPDRVSHLLLMNTAPASRADYALLRQHIWQLRTPDERARMEALRSDPAFEIGDPETVGNDFVPRECARHFAEAIPGAHFVELGDCGHFAYLECPEQLRTELLSFFGLPREHD